MWVWDPCKVTLDQRGILNRNVRDWQALICILEKLLWKQWFRKGLGVGCGWVPHRERSQKTLHSGERGPGERKYELYTVQYSLLAHHVRKQKTFCVLYFDSHLSKSHLRLYAKGTITFSLFTHKNGWNRKKKLSLYHEVFSMVLKNKTVLWNIFLC